VPDEPGVPGERSLISRLRAVIAAKDEQFAALAASLETALAALSGEREQRRRLELRVAELERRLSVDSADSGTPSSKERIGAKEARKARQQSERERREDRKRGGQPGHRGKGLERDPDPDEEKTADPPSECRSCRASLDGAETAEPRWAQVIDVEILRKVTEYLLPGLACGGCGTVTFADPPPGLHAGAVSYGPVLNAAAVLLSCYGNVPAERSARLIGMLLGEGVSPGWVDKAAARVNAQLRKAGFDEAMTAALAAEDVLAADETPVNVLDKTPVPAVAPDEKGEADPEEKDGKNPAGAPHVLIITTPDERLRLMLALGSRRKASVGAGVPAGFAGHLMTDGYTGYQHLLSRIAGIQQCCQHVIRRARAVTKLGPGGVQDWAGDIITVLGQAHRAVEDARARGSTALDPQVLDDLRGRYDNAVTSGMIHNRLRDWDTGNHPGYSLACWLRDYREQVLLFTRHFAVSWTNNEASAGPKPPSTTRQSRATGSHCPRSDAGAACTATWTPPPPTASLHSTPYAPPSKESPGYRRSPLSADSNSRHPVNDTMVAVLRAVPVTELLPKESGAELRRITSIKLSIDASRSIRAASASLPSNGGSPCRPLPAWKSTSSRSRNMSATTLVVV
jgi:transposase